MLSINSFLKFGCYVVAFAMLLYMYVFCIRDYIFTYIHQCIFDRHGIDVTITHLSSNHQGLMNTAARCTLLPPPFFLRHLDPYPPFARPPGHPLGGVWARWVREGREVARVESLRRGTRCNVARKKRDPCPSLFSIGADRFGDSLGER